MNTSHSLFSSVEYLAIGKYENSLVIQGCKKLGMVAVEYGLWQRE